MSEFGKLLQPITKLSNTPVQQYFLFLYAMLVAATPAASDSVTKIVVIGDSLVAGYGLKPEEGFTAQLEQALQDASYSVKIVNAGVSGDTTSGGLARADWILGDRYDAVILFLGANDALRAIPPYLVENNLRAIMDKLKERELPVLFVGMKAPRNLGPKYSEEFDSIYPGVAEDYDAVFYPFFLEGVATDLSLHQDDGIHPNKEGVASIVERMLPYTEQLFSRTGRLQNN